MKKNKKEKIAILGITIITLLIAVIGVSYAFFSSSVRTDNDNNEVETNLAVLASATMELGDKINASNIVPGHKILKTVQVIGSGPENARSIKAEIILRPDVREFSNHVKYTLYAVENSTIDANTICTASNKVNQNNQVYDDMTCNTANLGTPITSGIFEGEKPVIQEIDVSYNTNRTYYLIVEYLNDENGQDNEQGKGFIVNIEFVSHYVNPNMTIEYYLDGNKTNTIPLRTNNYESIEVNCSDSRDRSWNSENWNLNVEEYLRQNTTCTVSFERAIYVESLLNGTEPMLKDNLVPVTIDSRGNAIKADLRDEWYSYENKEWANSVILTSNPSKTYNAGDTILESDIESYFVWIPKYSYQLWDLGDYSSLSDNVDTTKQHEIPIRFGTTNTSNKTGECATPMTSGASGTCKIGDYMTHPAFISMNTNGLWVGKFETGYKNASSATAAEVNVEQPTNVVIKPNVYSWRGIQVANAFYTSYNYKRDLDSHMMKNTEWGAVSYLTNSKYGRCTSGVCEEIRINNNSGYVTGYAATDSAKDSGTSTSSLGSDGTNTLNYKNPLSVKASTTGNYSGIYDMSGGSWEYVMGVMNDTNNNPLSGRDSTNNSGFKGNYGVSGSNTTGYDMPINKYYDEYQYDNVSDSDYRRGILGDATKELGAFKNVNNNYISSWYNDFAYFILNTAPWTARGSDNTSNTNAGIFSFHHISGHEDKLISYRIILAP